MHPTSTKTKAFIGVDPGATGSICLLVPDNKHIFFISTVELPVSIYAHFKQIEKNYNLAPIMIEQVSPIPGSAAGANFKFGKNTGLLEGIIQCTGIGMDMVRPKAWQKSLGVPAKAKRGTALKKEVARLVTQIYPKAEIFGARGGLKDGKSDALAIAIYAAKQYA